MIEVPLGGFIKRTDDGRIDYVSPFRSPFNYGSVPDTLSGDGDRLDAVVLGPKRARGERVQLPVVAMVRFVDAGADDPKFVCSPEPLTPAERRTVVGFFRRYAHLKGLLNRVRGKAGPTRYDGLQERTGGG